MFLFNWKFGIGLFGIGSIRIEVYYICYTKFMPHLSGVFDEFPDLDKVSIEEIGSRIKPKPDVHALANFLGNRILYPQTVCLTVEEMELDLAILSLGVKLRPGLFYEPQSNKLLIPQRFVERFPNLELLIKAILEGVNPKGTHVIYIKNNSQLHLVGSVVSPIDPTKLSTDGKNVIFKGLAIEKVLPIGMISVIKTPQKAAKILLNEQEFDIFGGDAGIFIDLRMGEFAK